MKEEIKNLKLNSLFIKQCCRIVWSVKKTQTVKSQGSKYKQRKAN